jgi:predicted PurR-regulated permease PerM
MRGVMHHQKLTKLFLILMIPTLIVVMLKYGKPFLVPLTFACLISMLLLPVTTWLEKKRVNKAIAIILSLLMFVSFFLVIIGFVTWQASDMAQNASQIEEKVTEKYEQLQQYITEKLGIPPEKQQQIIKKQQASSQGKAISIVMGIASGIGGFAANVLLILVYIFLLIYYRAHIKRFIIHMAPDNRKDNALDILHQSQKVTQKYLSGMALMIAGLWIMYGIGFSIVGVKNAIFFAILCGVLELVPFVGNLVGNGLTIIMVLAQGGGTNMVIGVLVTYGIVQFIQSYILQPLVVGSEVNLNPLFTIIALIAGEAIWGIAGMVLSIPLMGIAKITCDRIAPLKPYGELIGQDNQKDSSFKNKIKGLWQK